jgi:hypothetical protein
VLISVDWILLGGTPGTNATLKVQTNNATKGAVLWSDNAFVDTAGIAGDTAPVGGAVVKSGTPLCAVAAGGGFGHLSLHGFLARDR